MAQYVESNMKSHHDWMSLWHHEPSLQHHHANKLFISCRDDAGFKFHRTLFWTTTLSMIWLGLWCCHGRFISYVAPFEAGNGSDIDAGSCQRAISHQTFQQNRDWQPVQHVLAGFTSLRYKTDLGPMFLGAHQRNPRNIKVYYRQLWDT